ncbi:nucleotide sugar dehydrogenase [Haloarcula montana]|uniref:nucleotide sugar dehydrogenase n=1 Tax=Haloarcula montana TaxID=3111776 RepID=UPI002D77970F|nr:nucleotide sugar dehydrogenase [Haloarcula sp. GH36]
MTDADVCVYGLGYIGLPTAAVLADSGHDVTGYDVDTELLRSIRDGTVSIGEQGLEALVTEVVASGALSVNETPVEADYHVICVPTPLDSAGQTADLGMVEAATEDVAAALTPGSTVILESTVPPGTTTGTVSPILEASGLVAGTEFGLVFSPETVLPGNILRELRSNNRIVGGIDDASTVAGTHLYESFTDGEIHETDATTAEMAKLAQNTFRDVNIAYANELAKIAHGNGVDSAELVDLANTHPRVTVHRPGPGVGGHCIPIDPWFLIEDTDHDALIGTARRVNDSMVDYVVEMLRGEVGPLAGRTVGVLGLAYKGNVSDARESPGMRVVERLRGEGATVLVNDPHVSDEAMEFSSLDDLFDRSDGVIVTTDHDEYAAYTPPQQAESEAPVLEDGSGDLIVDTKRVLDPEEWTASGYRLVQL